MNINSVELWVLFKYEKNLNFCLDFEVFEICLFLNITCQSIIYYLCLNQWKRRKKMFPEFNNSSC